MPDRRTVTIAVLVIGGIALVLWIMSQNRAAREGYSGEGGESSVEGTRVTVATLTRLVADDRETVNRWLGGKTVHVSGSVCLVAQVPDAEGGTTVLIGLTSAPYQDSATVVGFLKDAKDAERLPLHEQVELRGTLDLTGGSLKMTVTLKDAALVRPWGRGRSLR